MEAMNGRTYNIHPYIIMFGEKTEEKLRKALAYVQNLGYKTYTFHESDRNGELTAFATEIIERTEDFKKFQLLK